MSLLGSCLETYIIWPVKKKHLSYTQTGVKKNRGPFRNELIHRSSLCQLYRLPLLIYGRVHWICMILILQQSGDMKGLQFVLIV